MPKAGTDDHPGKPRADTDERRKAWLRLTDLLNQALDLEGEERQNFLDQLGQEDEVLQHRIEELLTLEAESEDEAFLSTPIFSLNAPASEEVVGRRMGAYELVRELGRGGMGAVYLAKRADGEFEQQVAIKILKRGMDTREIIGRFQAERQILAGLEHPNIAQLFDGGTTSDGLPYLVMEYIDGLPMDEYCDRNQLNVTRRLELFGEVCQAVQLAHQNLVVHRDLKPANILVTAQGVPKLLDFGVAKLLHQDPNLAMTATAQAAPLTPHYASPEQIRGDGITTAVDVYALGVLLYELLSGHRPYRIDTLTPQKLEAAICDQIPSRPSLAVLRDREIEGENGSASILSVLEISQSRATDPARLQRQLAGDLDTIVLRALRKEPSRRFPSVEQLSEDVRRYLTGMPISSRPDTWSYRTRKFIQRNVWGVAAASTILLLIVGFAISTMIQLERIQEQNRKITEQNQEITKQNDEIRLEVKRQQAVTRFLIDLVKTPDPNLSRGKTLTMMDALQRAESELADGEPEDPELRSMVLNAVGQVYMHLGELTKARLHLGEALKIRRNMAFKDSRQMAISLLNLGFLENLEGNMKPSETLLRQAIDLLREEEPERGHRLLALGLNNLAGLLRLQRRYEEAEPFAREGLALKDELAGDEDELAFSYNTLATIRFFLGDSEEAETYYRKALEIRREEGLDSTFLANTLNSLGALISDQKNLPAEGLPYLNEALEVRRRIFKKPHRDLLSSYHNLATTYLMLGRLKEAEENVEQAFRVASTFSSLPVDWTALLRRHRVAILEARGQWVACARDAHEILETYGEKIKRADHRAELESILGGCLAEQGEIDRARVYLEGSYRLLAEQLGHDRRATRQALVRLEKYIGAEASFDVVPAL